MLALVAYRLVVVAPSATKEFAYKRVVVALVVVEFVIVAPPIIASVLENESLTALVNRANVEKIEVEVAAVMVAREKSPPVTVISPVVVLIVKSLLPLKLP